jgi:hypothetical protein
MFVKVWSLRQLDLTFTKILLADIYLCEQFRDFFFITSCEAVSELRTVVMIRAIEVKEGVFQPVFDNIAS